jgi:ABC-type lipoprotein export system ATPase subunit
MLNLENIKVIRNQKEVLSIHSIKFDFNKRYYIYGSPGAGKTTLFETIAGIDRPQTGDVLVEGVSLYNSGFMELSLLRKKMGVMFDLPGLISNQNILENINLAIESKKIIFERPVKDIILNDYLSFFYMEDILEMRPGLLSSEQKKIAAFIRAIIAKPSFLIFDGFTDFLNGTMKNIKIKFLDELYEKSVGGIFMGKDLKDLNLSYDCCYELKNGELYEL